MKVIQQVASHTERYFIKNFVSNKYFISKSLGIVCRMNQTNQLILTLCPNLNIQNDCKNIEKILKRGMILFQLYLFPVQTEYKITSNFDWHS